MTAIEGSHVDGQLQIGQREPQLGVPECDPFVVHIPGLSITSFNIMLNKILGTDDDIYVSKVCMSKDELHTELSMFCCQ